MLPAVLGYFVGIQIAFGNALRELLREARGISQAIDGVRHLVTAEPNLGQALHVRAQTRPLPRIVLNRVDVVSGAGFAYPP